jgi:hypothetical protein
LRAQAAVRHTMMKAMRTALLTTFVFMGKSFEARTGPLRWVRWKIGSGAKGTIDRRPENRRN